MLDLNGNPTPSYNAELKVWSGASEPSYYNEDLTIGQIIFEQLQNDPHRIFQVSHTEKTRLTRCQVLENAIKVSTYLRQQGFNEETDIVGILARNSTHLAALAYGCMFNGTPYHAINPNLDEETINKLFDVTAPRILCCDAQDYEKIRYVAKAIGAQVLILHGEILGVLSIRQLLEAPLQQDFKPSSFHRGIDRTMAILCSSGTTGTPKAVTISNNHHIFQAHSYISPNDVIYAPSTLDWLTGLIALVVAGVYGPVRIISNDAFTPGQFLIMCELHGITWTILGSSFIAVLANSPEVNAKQLLSLRYLLFGGGHTLVSTLYKMQAYLQNDNVLHNVYGLTELGTLATFNSQTLTKPGSVGGVLGGIRMCIVDEAGASVGPNELGEIYCNNGHVWHGYFKNPSATAEMQDSDGWYRTGDLGYFDDDNYLHIVDRKKDMLKFMGMMYYPHEIEEIIAQIPEVAEVCVCGIWNETEGDAAAAAIVPKSGSQLTAHQVVQFVKQNISVNYKQLNGGAQLVPQLARSPNGKLNRRAVKEAYLKAAQLKEPSDSLVAAS